MSTHVAASSQLFYSLATLVITKARPRLAEDKLDEIEGIRAEVMRYGTKRTKYKNKLVWGFSCTVIGKKKIRTDTSVRMKRTKRPWEQEKMRVNYAGRRQRGTKLLLLTQKDPNCGSKKGCWRLFHSVQGKNRKLGRRKDQMARCLAEKGSSDARPPQSDLRCS